MFESRCSDRLIVRLINRKSLLLSGRDSGYSLVIPPLLPLLLFILLASTELRGQPAQSGREIDWTVGVTGLLGISSHSIPLDIYEGFPGCGTFRNQISTRLEGRAFFERPLFLIGSVPIDLFVGLSLQNRSISFSEASSSPGRTSNGEVRTIVTQHRYDAELYGIGGMLGLAIEPIEGLRLTVAPMLQYIGDRQTRQYERIASPLGAVFVGTDSFERPIDRGGDISFRKWVPGLAIWGGARFVVASDFGIEPGLGVEFDLGDIEETYPWRTTTLQVGLSIFRQKVTTATDQSADLPPPVLAAREPDPPPPAPIQVIDTVPAGPPPYLEVRIVAWGVDERGNRYRDPIIEIREAPYRQTIPILPYLFFDSVSATLPERYLMLETSREAEVFHVDSLLYLSPMLAYRHLPNILGARLRGRPEVSMTIVGTQSSDEGSDSVALRRAETIQDYFVQVWGIDRRRLQVRSGEPTLPSSEETVEGREENRRVEFRFDGESLLNPVIIERLARVASPPAVTFEKEVIADTALAKVVVRVLQGEKELLRFVEGESDGESSRFWPLSDLRINRDLTPIRYRFEVTDVTGQMAVDQGEFRVSERVTREGERSVEINEYLLAGFVYNSADLSPAHVSAIYEIARIAGEDAWVEVVGFTDEVGDDVRNRQLAVDRADRVATAMRNARRELGMDRELEIQIRGSGEIDAGEFDNSLPEGRIFSRMVRVTIHRQRD